MNAQVGVDAVWTGCFGGVWCGVDGRVDRSLLLTLSYNKTTCHKSLQFYIGLGFLPG